MNLERHAAYETILYFDLFDFAPNLLEIEKWLLAAGRTPGTLYQLKHEIDTLPQVSHEQGFYFLNGRNNLVQLRKQKYDFTEAKWKRAKPFLRLLSALPYVEAIWLANSMGWNNAKQSSDIDLIIVTTPGHIWTARFFTTALMKILRQRPHEQSMDKAICLSFYMSRDHLNVEPYKIGEEDIHYSFWSAQFYPIYDPENLYEQYKKENGWTNEIFSHLEWTAPTTRRTIHIGTVARIFKALLRALAPEKLLKNFQLRILPEQLREMANEDNRVVINDHILKLHTNDQRERQHEEWKRRLRNA